LLAGEIGDRHSGFGLEGLLTEPKSLDLTSFRRGVIQSIVVPSSLVGVDVEGASFFKLSRGDGKGNLINEFPSLMGKDGAFTMMLVSLLFTWLDG